MKSRLRSWLHQAIAVVCCGCADRVSAKTDYYYRFETAKGWSNFFKTGFTITERKGNAGDLRNSPEYAKNLKNTGNDRAFYFYDTYENALLQLKQRLPLGSTAYNRVHDEFQLAFLSRIKKCTPALKWRKSHVDRSDERRGAKYILPSLKCFEIPASHIEIYLDGQWWPKNGDAEHVILNAYENIQSMPYEEFCSRLRPPS
jgi:hypothetical protein